jgi:hypothetical protein
MKIYRRRAYIMTLLTLSLVIPGVSAAHSNQDSGRGMSQTDSASSGVHDFDFLVGHWRVHHRKLKERLANSHEWIEFEGTLSSQPLMGGYSNVDDLVLDAARLSGDSRISYAFPPVPASDAEELRRIPRIPSDSRSAASRSLTAPASPRAAR